MADRTEQPGAESKLLAEWFWTDRWMGSSGFLLPLEARGLYREMLTQAWRRGARLPNDHEAIQRATGVTAEEWTRSWPLVALYWQQDTKGFLVNDTQLAVYAEAKARADRATARGLRGAQARWNAQASAQASLEECPPSPSPSPDQDHERTRTRGNNRRVFSGRAFFVTDSMHAIVKRSLGKRDNGIDWRKLYEAADAAYAESGEPKDRLSDLKLRARAAVEARQDYLVWERKEAERRKRDAEWRQDQQRIEAMTSEEREAERVERKRIMQEGRKAYEKALELKAQKDAEREAAHRARRFGPSRVTSAEREEAKSESHDVAAARNGGSVDSHE